MRYDNLKPAVHRDACHEIGDTLGLDHNFYKTSCLYGTITTDSSRYPAAGDYSILEEIY